MGEDPDFPMRMAELSATSGVPVPTVKLYLREGLLPPGERTSPNQARYGPAHVRRLLLVRALREVANLPVAAIKVILGALDDPAGTLHDALGAAQEAITPAPGPAPGPAAARAAATVDRLSAEQGWSGCASPARSAVEGALAAIYALGADNGGSDALLSAYAGAAQQVARADLAGVAAEPDADQVLTTAVVWTVLGDAVLAGLRRMAQQEASARVFGG